MTKEVAPVAPAPKTAVELFKRDDVKNKFIEILGKRGNAFTSSVLTLISQNDRLKSCDPNSVYMCAMMAATLDLPVNSNLGFAYIIPYGNQAQFQMGYKGFKQLAMRSGQVKKMNAAPIYKDQIVSQDPLKGWEFDFSVLPAENERPVGYAAYIELTNGFEKTVYMSVKEIEEHGKKYSKSYKNGPWNDNFPAMAMKTVMKRLLNGGEVPLSTEMQQAIVADQAIIKNAETLEVDYKDVSSSVVDLEDLVFLYEGKKSLLPAHITINADRIIQGKEEANYAKLYKEIEEFVPEAKATEKK